MSKRKDYGNGWIHEFPTEEGQYWFHGDRFSNSINPPETLFCTVHKTGNDVLIVKAGGGFMFKGELGTKWAFKKTSFPELPTFE